MRWDIFPSNSGVGGGAHPPAHYRSIQVVDYPWVATLCQWWLSINFRSWLWNNCWGALCFCSSCFNLGTGTANYGVSFCEFPQLQQHPLCAAFLILFLFSPWALHLKSNICEFWNSFFLFWQLVHFFLVCGSYAQIFSTVFSHFCQLFLLTATPAGHSSSTWALKFKLRDCGLLCFVQVNCFLLQV